MAFFIAAAAFVVGAFLPWLKLTTTFLGTRTISFSGMDRGGDGWFFVGAGVVIGLFGFGIRRASRPHRLAAGALVTAVLAGLFLVIELKDIADRIDTARSSELGVGSHGWGLYLLGAAVFTTWVGGWVYLLQERRP